MDDPHDFLRAEARLFGRYLVRVPPSDSSVERYVGAVTRSIVRPSVEDLKLLAFARRHPASISLLDAGLALTRPSSALRGRLFLMFAILEATTDHHDRFLPVARSPAHVPLLALTALRAALKGLAGAVLVRLVSL
jgi:hypothetical protein